MSPLVARGMELADEYGHESTLNCCMDNRSAKDRARAALLAYLEEIARDAERYRFLRDQCYPDMIHVARERQDSWGNWRMQQVEGAELDAAIVSAIASQQGGTIEQP